MGKNLRKSLFAMAGMTALVVLGCGGSGGAPITTGGDNGGDNGGGGSNVPTAKTKADVQKNITAYEQSAVNDSFVGYGSKLQSPGGNFYDVPLGLYATIKVSPSGTNEKLFTDAERTIPAGSLQYTINEVAFTYSGPITVTGGKYSGLNGVYFEAIQSDGYNGSINYTTALGGTIVSSFAVKYDDFGAITGTSTIGVALAGDYTQNQQVTYNADKTSNITSLDSNSCRTTIGIGTNDSGTGQITGADPGLPATINWNSDGTGQVKFADGSVLAITNWVLAG